MQKTWDNRRDYAVPGDSKETVAWAADHWIHSAERAIQQRGRFAVALSGGKTPKAIYEAIRKKKLDWSKVWLFWSDERNVPPDHESSNYRMAMESLGCLPISSAQIIRMQTEKDIENQAFDYEEKIKHYLGKHLFDLVMLGLGEDGHTASLFPHTAALAVTDRLVVANYLADKKSWRMTLTFPAIEQSRQAVIYALGAAKQTIVSQVLKAPIESNYPASRIGTPEHKALWIMDLDAAQKIS